MEKQIPPSIFTPIQPPKYSHTKKPVDKKKYLDELFTKEWMNKYFNMTSDK